MAQPAARPRRFAATTIGAVCAPAITFLLEQAVESSRPNAAGSGNGIRRHGRHSADDRATGPRSSPRRRRTTPPPNSPQLGTRCSLVLARRLVTALAPTIQPVSRSSALRIVASSRLRYSRSRATVHQGSGVGLISRTEPNSADDVFAGATPKDETKRTIVAPASARFQMRVSLRQFPKGIRELEARQQRDDSR